MLIFKGSHLPQAIVLLALACPPAAAQQMQPGEWQFTSTVTSPAFPGPQTAAFTNCVKKEDASDPSRWMGRKDYKSDCKVTPGKKTADSYSWQISCPGSKTQGAGTVRFAGGTRMESDTRMTTEQRGRKLEMRTQMSGKRVGPCKS